MKLSYSMSSDGVAESEKWGPRQRCTERNGGVLKKIK